MSKSYVAKEAEVQRRWVLLDAENKPAGRLAVRIVAMLRGKDRPTYTPHVDTGDFVLVINAAKIALTGRKEEQKIYQDYTGYNSGLKLHTAAEIRRKHPDRILRQAVRGMLPKNRLSRGMMRRLKVYPGAEHPHEAQQPVAMDI